MEAKRLQNERFRPTFLETNKRSTSVNENDRYLQQVPLVELNLRLFERD
jgi:hypothetical protein